MNGRGHVEPNPMVGCVLVKNGQVIGEGWHQKYGEAHAEPNALIDCKSRGNNPAGATAYVTLEPCCHTNKQTPPCAPRLIEARIARVVIGCLDPNPDVNGKGVAMLRAAGIEVETLPGSIYPEIANPDINEARYQFLEWASRHPAERSADTRTASDSQVDASHFQQLISPFILRQAFGDDAYITLKWAESADGRVAGKNGERVQITNPLASRVVHELRARCGAILIGVNTAINDDPELTVRGIELAQQPTRVVLDRELRIPAHAKLIRTNREGIGGLLLVICSQRTLQESPRVAELEALGVRVTDIDSTLDLVHGLEFAIQRRDEIQRNRHLLVEPGPTLARSMLPVAHRLWIFRSTKKIGGGPSAPRAADIPDYLLPIATLDLAGDTLTEYLNTRSPAFFAATPSADFVLAGETVARASGTCKE